MSFFLMHLYVTDNSQQADADMGNEQQHTENDNHNGTD
jgi:hypothetical protein